MPSTSVAALLTQLNRSGGLPRITWYGDDFERVELSGAVLDNWVSKTTNLLVEEFDAAPGVRVLLDLPPHWRSLVWALAVWRTGATLTPTGPADVVVTTRPDEHAADAVVAVTLGALARRFDGPLPRGAIDAASAVMTYADVVGYVPPTDPTAAALGATSYADLPAWWADGEAARVAFAADDDVTDWLRRVVATLAADGSVVAISPGRLAELARTAGALDRLLETERAVLV